MKVSVALHIFGLLGLCSCANVPEHSFKGSDYDNVTLDLAHPDKLNVIITNEYYGKADYRVFTARIQQSLAKVVYNHEVVWEYGRGKKATSVNLISRGGVPYLSEVVMGPTFSPSSSYRERENGKWVRVDKARYDKKAYSLFTEDPGAFTLDTENVDTNKVSLIEADYHNLHNRIALAKVDFHMNRIMCGKQLIWEAKNGMHATSVNVLYRAGEAKLFKILIGQSGNNLVFIENENGKLTQITKEYYHIKYDRFFAEQAKFGATIDLSKSNNPDVVVYGQNTNGLSYKHFVPKYGLKAVYIVDGGVPVWKAQSGSKITGVVIYSAYGEAIFRLHAIDTKNKLSQHYFEKVNGIWKPTDFSTFFKRVGELTEGASKVIKVDVLSSQKGSFTNTVYNDYGVETRLVSPLGGSKIAALYHGKERVWEGKSGEYCTSATFFKRGSLYICSVEAAGKELFFEHFDGHWVHIDADTFQDRYGKIFISGKLSDKSSVIKVDASAPQDGSFNNVVYNDYGVETRLVSPFAGFKISALYYGNSLVWEGAKGQYCTIATFFKKYDMHICSVIINGQREEFFENIGGMWVDVDEKVFSDAYLKILSGKEAEERKEIDIYTLDIASLPEETEIVKPRENSPYTFSIVAHGTPITKVVDGDSTIWTGSDEELCISSSFLSDGKKNLLAQIVVEGHNEETELLYFQKRTFGWYQITENLYDFLIEGLKVNEDGFLTASFYAIPLLFAVVSGIFAL
ncbi:uncharacterized protein BEWA_000030 [Theileria equi strain WA]|uniref:Membrane protein, putative n=1 Tax=Theileria equi strain WA TaxID=1537102 RepID=L1LBR2_THEEQ|nr:uncharacterized protein BEWA_000030 [Theileria equi strain WA]EKX72618.1 membrane protein, putative [Theileria equi strain WA]|eukprot:XP_004832070.1 uncharacterized protein BEWA_000030 [Theileria equi strain WA]